MYRVVLIDATLARFRLVRFHIHDIVLLKIIAGRIEDIRRTQIMEQDRTFTIILTDHRHTIATTVNRKVTCHT